MNDVRGTGHFAVYDALAVGEPPGHAIAELCRRGFTVRAVGGAPAPVTALGAREPAVLDAWFRHSAHSAHSAHSTHSAHSAHSGAYPIVAAAG